LREGGYEGPFNGVAATFTVESASYIKTNVPAGATTGPVRVVTPSRTLTSNMRFQVLQ
jgi:large repetitive protein